MFGKITKKLVSGLLALAMLTSNALPLMPITVGSEESEPAAAETTAAHTIAVFDIDIKSGAEYYASYVPDNPAESGQKSISDAYVWQADNANEGHKFIYNIKFSISGEGTTDDVDENGASKEAVSEEGFIEIRIPAHILKYKNQTESGIAVDGIYPDEAELPVPNINQMEYKLITVTDEDGNPVLDEDENPVTKREYTTNHQFVYKLDDKGTPDDESDDEYVIYNIQPVSAGVVYELPVAYRMNKNTWEYQDLGASDPCKATVKVQSWVKDGTPADSCNIEMETREIPVYIDTSAKIESTVKRADTTQLMTTNDIFEKTGYRINDADDEYRYVIWSITSKIPDVTQKYSLNLTDMTAPLTGTDGEGNQHIVTGDVVAVKMGNSEYTSSDTAFVSGLTASGTRTDYVITRYPYHKNGDKEGVENLLTSPKTGVYSASNMASVELTPADGQDDETSADSTAMFKFEVKDPVFNPVETKYSAEKYGLYNGNNRVWNKNHISSYELAKLLKEMPVSGLRYRTNTSAHAYGKTIENLNTELTEMVVNEPDENGYTVILAGTRKYIFNANNTQTYTLEIDDSAPQTMEIKHDPPYTAPLDSLDMQRIAAQEIADNYYGQQALEYIFEDKTFTLTDEEIPLDENDYQIDSVAYVYTVKETNYDYDNMEFSAKDANAEFSDIEENNILAFYVWHDDADEPELAGTYNIHTGKASEVNSALVKSLSGSQIVFADTANVTGYQIKTKNLYFYVELKTTPSITLKPSEKIKEIVKPMIEDAAQAEKKIALRNDASWNVLHDTTELLNEKITGTDYIADIVRTSDISKKALGEKVTIKGQDGKTYRSMNDTLLSQYQLAWQSKIAETANGVEVNGQIKNNVPVRQESGIFYDLLPSHCDIIEGSVNVYIDANRDVGTTTKALSPSAFEVLDRIDNYHGSGKKLLVVKINAPCDVSYTVTYVTVHSHMDIQDYGSLALNTVAYQTGNEDIGSGYPDDGGNYAVSMSDYIKNLDPDNGDAKRFIYAEATEDILALFPTSSGVYKKVSTQSDPTYRRSGVVYSGETYTYSIRMQNDSSTKARDIAFMDSMENYRTVNGVQYNSGLNKNRDWYGTIQSFDLSDIENKISEYAINHPSTSVNDLKLILYVSDDAEHPENIVDLESKQYSDSEARKYLLYNILNNKSKANAAAQNLTEAEKAAYDAIAKKWKVVNDWRDLSGIDMSKVTAFIVYTGEHFVLGSSGSVSFTVKMKTPSSFVENGTADVENGKFLTPPMTYNNIYRSFTNFREEANDNVDETQTTYFYTHYDYTQLQYRTVGDLEFTKSDSATNEPIEGVEFNLSGISDYGTVYNETLYSDSMGYVTFKNLERGTYTLTETVSDPDHLLDTTPRTVTVDPQGEITIVTMNNAVVKENEKYIIRNNPRYHGDFEFRKVDSLTGNGISNTTFTLTGISEYNTSYNIETVSDSNGTVSFGDIEKGTYTLTELSASDGYLPPKVREYTVTSSGEKDLIFRITGENAGNAGTEYQIKNVPFAEMKLQKVDSITNEPLNDAIFTLTADKSLNDKIQDALNRLAQQGTTDTGWSKDSNSNWVQTVENSNSSVSGEYLFKNLLEGKYTLKEETIPNGYEKTVTEYQVTVTEDKNLKRYVITFDSTDEMTYIELKNGDFAETDKDTAQYYRILNNETYEDGKTIVKSWIGGTPQSGKFPIIHLSSEKLEASAVKVTIDKEKFKSVAISSMTSFTFNSSPPENAIDAKDYSYDETGKFKIWKVGNVVYWYSNANIIYLPADCEELFKELNQITSLDLTAFYADKVTSMEGMFQNCSKLKEIHFNNNAGDNFKNGQNITTLKSMFEGCSVLEGVDLQYLTTTSNLTDTSSMFKNCSKIASIDITSLDTSAVTDMSYMFGMENNKQNTSLKNLDTSHLTAGSALKSVEGMFRNLQYLTGLDLRGFGNCSNLETINSWFYNCHRLSYIDLSNFETSTNLKDSSLAFYYCSRYTGDDVRSAAGVAIFAKGKWIFASEVKTNNNTFEYCRVNLYGHMYKNSNEIYYDAENNKIQTSNFTGSVYYAKGDIKHFDIQKQGELIVSDDGHKNIVNAETAGVRAVTGYFNDAFSDYYNTWANEHYSDTENTTPSVPDESAPTEKTEYKNFKEDGSPVYQENTTATANDVGKKTFTFEYVTAETGSPVDGESNAYTVKETIYLTVNEVVEEEGKYYTVSQKYTYNKPVTAIWTEVTTTAPTQWYCEMNVFNADDEFFAWENVVKDYESTATNDNPIKTVGRNDTPVITNSTPETVVGSLELKKTLQGTDSEKFYGDSFWFKVTMKDRNSNPYTMLPFDKDGIAYFEVKPNVDEEDKVIISGIPESCTYKVEEINDKEHLMPDGYTKETETNPSGTIKGNQIQTAEIENSINAVNLSLIKQAELYENTANSNEFQKVTSGEDYEEWTKNDFTFTVTFNNLVKGQEYTYKIGDEAYYFEGNSNSADTTIEEITVKSGQTVTFLEIPAGTAYTITETSEFEDIDDIITYQTVNNVNNTVGNTTGEQVLNEIVSVTFTNIKKIDRTKIPQTVEVTIHKEWYAEDGTKVTWKKDADGDYLKDENGNFMTEPSGNYPSFLKVYLGRALQYNYTDVDGSPKTVYLDIETSYTSYSLKAKEDWSYTFTDLPKSGEMVLDGETIPCDYVYYVTEVVPIGFHNSNTEAYTSISTSKYFVTSDKGDNRYGFTLKNTEDPTYHLSVCKLVTGNMGNKTKEFTFEIEFRKDGKPLTGTGFTMRFTDVYDSTYVRNRTYTLENGKISISLPHGRMVQFLSIPKGTQYTITETTADNYEVHSGTYTGNVTDVKIDTLQIGKSQTGQLDNDMNYLYMNDLTGEIPTGILLSASVSVTIAISIIGFLFFRCKVKLKREDEEQKSS